MDSTHYIHYSLIFSAKAIVEVTDFVLKFNKFHLENQPVAAERHNFVRICPILITSHLVFARSVQYSARSPRPRVGRGWWRRELPKKIPPARAVHRELRSLAALATQSGRPLSIRCRPVNPSLSTVLRPIVSGQTAGSPMAVFRSHPRGYVSGERSEGSRL